MDGVRAGTLCSPTPELDGELYCVPQFAQHKRIFIFSHHKLVLLYSADREYPRLYYFILGDQIVGLIEGEFKEL